MLHRAIVLLIAVALGCTDTEAPAGQCRFDSDCDEGLVCAGTYCRAQCSTDRDCPSGQRCSESDRFGVLTCHVVAAQAQCSRTSDCPAGLSCLDGTCRVQCQEDYDCQVINPYFRCVANACSLTCAAGRGDCDRDPRNGCEVDLAGDPRHCRACGTACTAGANADPVCAATGCTTRCRTGYADCDGSAANGCEVELATDTANCGTCGRACTVANGQGRCMAGTCARATCNATFDDCDGAAANGCEARIDTATNCGRCGNACTANMMCSTGACASSCAAGTTLCGTSCVDLSTSATSCGRCDNACPSAPNAAPACVTSACTVVCNAGYVATSAGCTAVAAPRLVSPPSLSTFNGSRNLVFEVALAAATDGAVIELCRDRACATVVERFMGSAARVVRSGALTPGTYFWRAYGRSGAATGLTPSAQTWEVRVPSRAIDATAAWGNTLDINGDGNVDVALGESRAHRIHVYLGTVTGAPTRPTATITGAAGSEFGRELAAGDFNGDGFADLAVNSPESSELFIHSGGAAGLGATGARRESPSGAGYSSLAAASDLNHDGYADLVAGYFFCPKGCFGGVDVFLGGPAGLAAAPVETLTLEDRFNDFGQNLAAVGRLSPDSPYESIVVLSSSKGPGSVLTYRGTATGIATTPTQTFVADSQAVQVAAANDVNGDGFADVAILEQNFTAGSQLRLYAGSATGLAATALTTTTEMLNSALSSVGDVNGDGFADLIASDGFTVARVFFGAATGPMTLGPVFSAPLGADGARVYARFGGASARVGDLNRDGFDDLAIGAPDDGDSVCRGGLLIFPGRMTFTAPFTPAVVVTVPDDVCSGNFAGAIASYARPRSVAPRG